MKRAFTLIELMIVVAIIGILAALAIPNFVKFQCRAKQSEVKTVLKNIIVAQEAFRGEGDRYVAGSEADLRIIAVAVSGSVRRYDFVVDSATTTTYHAVGTANNDRGGDLVRDGSPDTWEANQTGALTPILNACD